jgi:hypothetical protein
MTTLVDLHSGKITLSCGMNDYSGGFAFREGNSVDEAFLWDD